MQVEINYLAVLLATLASLVIGALWYSPLLFVTPWMKLARIEPKKDAKSVFQPILVSAIVALATAYILAHVSFLSNQFFHHSFFQDTMVTAFWMWLGFSAARFITHDAFEGRPNRLTLITLGYEFFTFMAMGLIIGALGV